MSYKVTDSSRVLSHFLFAIMVDNNATPFLVRILSSQLSCSIQFHRTALVKCFFLDFPLKVCPIKSAQETLCIVHAVIRDIRALHVEQPLWSLSLWIFRIVHSIQNKAKLARYLWILHIHTTRMLSRLLPHFISTMAALPQFFGHNKNHTLPNTLTDFGIHSSKYMLSFRMWDSPKDSIQTGMCHCEKCYIFEYF